MTDLVAASSSPQAAPADAAPRPARTDLVVGRRALHQVWRGAAICAAVFGLTVVSSALAYVKSFPDEASRQLIAATTSSDTGLAVLLGPVASVDTVGGYTVYKCFVFLTTIGAIWGLLAATRVLRGEEDAGRWQVLLAGATRPARATAATLVALMAAVGIVFVGTTAITLAFTRGPDVDFGVGETVLYGLSLTVAPAVFVAVGALTSQLGRTRRTATGVAMAVFGVAFVLRMIADTGPGAHWLLWTTPFGWTQLMAPFTENNAWPLVPAVLTVAVLGGAAARLAARRDVGAGVLASRDTAPPRSFGLRSPLGLAARLELPVLTAWCAGAAASAFAFGIIAKLTTASIPDSMSDTLDNFGVQGTFARQYFGVAFLLSATLVALLPASQVGAAADEETSGRLSAVLAGPPTRAAWFAGRLALTAAAVVVAAAVTGLFAWLGSVSQGVDLGLATMLGAGLNLVPTALVALGLGAVVLALAPRSAALAVYGVVIASVVIDLVGALVTDASWLERLSLFHYMALAPAQDVDAATVVITVVVGLALAATATVMFARRDYRSA